MLNVNISIKLNFRRTIANCICFRIKLWTFDNFFQHLQDTHNYFSIIKKNRMVVETIFLLCVDWSCPSIRPILTRLDLTMASWMLASPWIIVPLKPYYMKFVFNRLTKPVNGWVHIISFGSLLVNLWTQSRHKYYV